MNHPMNHPSNCNQMRVVNGRIMVCVNPEPESTPNHSHWFKHADDAIAHSYYELEAIENV